MQRQGRRLRRQLRRGPHEPLGVAAGGRRSKVGRRATSAAALPACVGGRRARCRASAATDLRARHAVVRDLRQHRQRLRRRRRQRLQQERRTRRTAARAATSARADANAAPCAARRVHDRVVPGGLSRHRRPVADGCEYGPCFTSGGEVCNGLDDDCNGARRRRPHAAGPGLLQDRRARAPARSRCARRGGLEVRLPERRRLDRRDGQHHPRDQVRRHRQRLRRHHRRQPAEQGRRVRRHRRRRVPGHGHVQVRRREPQRPGGVHYHHARRDRAAPRTATTRTTTATASSTTSARSARSRTRPRAASSGSTSPAATR